MTTKIKELRCKIKMTQEELAERVGVTRMTILFLEKGKYNPSLILAYKISKVFNVPIENIFIFNDNSR